MRKGLASVRQFKEDCLDKYEDWKQPADEELSAVLQELEQATKDLNVHWSTLNEAVASHNQEVKQELLGSGTPVGDAASSVGIAEENVMG